MLEGAAEHSSLLEHAVHASVHASTRFAALQAVDHTIPKSGDHALPEALLAVPSLCSHPFAQQILQKPLQRSHGLPPQLQSSSADHTAALLQPAACCQAGLLR